MVLVGLLSIIGFLAFIGVLVYSLIKKKPKKVPLLGLAVCFVLFIAAATATPAEPEDAASVSVSAPAPATAPSGQTDTIKAPAATPEISQTQTPAPSPLTGDLIISYLDVGQADSEFIELPTGQTMLIDAGNEDDGNSIVRYLKDRGCKVIDFLIATHPHADHIGGMTEVVSSFEISAIYMPKVSHNTQTFEDVLTAISDKGLSVKTAKAGVTLLDTPELKVFMIAPNSDVYEDLNNYSAVIKIVYRSNAFLFMGDAEQLSENEITADVSADVLKVGHHGSDSSTGGAFLKKVSPGYAVISVGAGNDYNHPAQSVLDALTSAGASIYRTDMDGTVVFTSDGTSITFNKKGSYREPAVTSPDTAPGAVTGTVVISKVDKKGELVTIKNKGNTDVVLTGWVLVSVKGSQSFSFPSYTLKAGGTVTIASGDASGDLKWTTKNVWNNSESDPAELYDSRGTLIDKFGS